MKIGIMSMQRVHNYGSFLQAYALKKMIEEIGHEVVFVDYHVEPCVVETNATQNIIFLQKIIRFIKHRNTVKKRRMYRKAKSFSKVFDECLPILGILNDMNYNTKVDVLVIGSDEVFNCLQDNRDVGFSLELFGKDAKAKYVITYAASFGTTTLDKLKKYKKDEVIGNYLNLLNAISVRDNNSREVVLALTGKQPEVNLDPVLMYDFPVEIPVIKDNGFIAVYAYRGRITEKEGKVIQEYARKKNKKLFAIGGVLDFCDEYIVATPFEIMGYIRAADEVITDTFHGTVFSIKYNKNFVCLIRESNYQKLSDLLERLALMSQCAYETDDICRVLENESIEWEKINNILISERAHTKDYLERNLYE